MGGPDLTMPALVQQTAQLLAFPGRGIGVRAALLARRSSIIACPNI